MKGISNINPGTANEIILNGRRLVRKTPDTPTLEHTESLKKELKPLEKQLADYISSACVFRSYIEKNKNTLSIDAQSDCHERLWDLEERIESLKEEIRDIKARHFKEQQEAKLAKK